MEVKEKNQGITKAFKIEFDPFIGTVTVFFSPYICLAAEKSTT